MSELLRFQRWPMWTLGAQSGVMVGSPRRLKASLKPEAGPESRQLGWQDCAEGRKPEGVLTSRSASLKSSRRAPACCCSEI